MVLIVSMVLISFSFFDTFDPVDDTFRIVMVLLVSKILMVVNGFLALRDDTDDFAGILVLINIMIIDAFDLVWFS